MGQNITSHHFNFPFYLSRKLDIDEKVQKRTDQHSIRFEHYNGSTVIAISGNYYGAYAADKFNDEQRARQTFQDVVVPIMKAVVPTFQGNSSVQGYAVEVSHHVISKTMGMPIERPENLMIYFPQAAAVKLVTAQNNMAMQGALIDADVLLNAKQLSIWLTDEDNTSVKESAPRCLLLPLRPFPPSQLLRRPVFACSKRALLCHSILSRSAPLADCAATHCSARLFSPGDRCAPVIDSGRQQSHAQGTGT